MLLFTSSLAQLSQMICQLQLSLDLSSQLLHLPPALSVLSPDDLYDRGEHRHPHQDVDGADQHVARLVSTNKIRNYVSEPNSGHCDETKVESVEKCNVFVDANEVGAKTMQSFVLVLHNFVTFNNLKKRQRRRRAPPAVFTLSINPTSIFSSSSSLSSFDSSFSEDDSSPSFSLL